MKRLTCVLRVGIEIYGKGIYTSRKIAVTPWTTLAASKILVCFGSEQPAVVKRLGHKGKGCRALWLQGWG